MKSIPACLRLQLDPTPVQILNLQAASIVLGWKFMSCSHCQELLSTGRLAILIGYTRVKNQSEARSAS